MGCDVLEVPQQGSCPRLGRERRGAAVCAHPISTNRGVAGCAGEENGEGVDLHGCAATHVLLQCADTKIACPCQWGQIDR